MSQPDRANLTIQLVRDDEAYRATEPGVDVVGRGDTAHEAVIDYTKRAREESEAKADG